ncbi:MAG: 5-formyltetrahydrofolate cyclo-ligase [Gammaproteobacteria bacterium]|nr:5-formyltetrahydrofolate cyclo-ligase [Gammaproteobacteria bacterium]|tara:strand:+ start:2966 stop:3730 length:765 start_codon:yes stop_codon:yes gene_type:complete
MGMDKHRWGGRNSLKDTLRNEIWKKLESSGAAIGNPWSKIPNFDGSQEAALRLTELDFWQSARVVKSNPDSAQAWVRLYALQAGKMVFTPVPELTKDFPFLLLDPEDLSRKGIAFEQVMYSDGAVLHGQRVDFNQMEPMDICVVGSVAASIDGGRTGKGGGFADLEMGVFRSVGTLSDECPVVTTVSEIQIVENGDITLEEHDTPMDWVITPKRSIETKTSLHKPGPIDWTSMQEDQFINIPFLEKLKNELSNN